MIRFSCKRFHRLDHTPIIRDVEIERQTEALLRDYKPELLEYPMAINPDHFAESYLGLTLDYQRIFSLENNVVGATVFNDDVLFVEDEEDGLKPIRVHANTIVIHEEIAQQKKFHTFLNFTILHECGHAWMHESVYRRNDSMASFHGEQGTQVGKVQCLRCTMGGATKKLVTEEDFREHQANTFAAAMAMPLATFVPYAQWLLKKYGFGDYIDFWDLEKNGEAYINYQHLLSELAKEYDISMESATIRFSKLGFVRTTMAVSS